ncbi:hypothetical protein AGMMS50212_11720 [Spirochaetia bacterium]|nr:hypothetical protein AGMMS50212_11720 [Spirochaetia bacterium]
MDQLITVDKSKCNNCHSCVTVCPVKMCIDASGDIVSVVDKLCLGCGRCIPACTKNARSYNDDTEQFFNDLAAGQEIVTIVAPAAAAVFGDILKLNGYLKSKGVKANFDVSFGAELTVKSYLNHAEKNKPPVIIAQPCAAIVTYCEIYKPELLQWLAPAHSPMLHTAAMIKHFFPKYSKAKIAAISPCAAKKREFEETGLVHYNVTLLRLKEKLADEKKSIASFSSVEYEGPQAERAVLFSTPGGLRDTVARDAPAVVPKIRKIEGTEIIYRYLNELPEMLKEGSAPFIVDCLNCEAGCNGGPGTGNYHEPIDRLEAKIAKRSAAHIEKNKKTLGGGRLKRAVKKYWKEDIYKRSYKNLEKIHKQIKIPSYAELQSVFTSMHKFRPEDMFNCSACGYGTCLGMANAIFNGFNKKENCHHFLKAKIISDDTVKKEAVDLANHLIFEVEKSKETLQKLHAQVSNYIGVTTRQGEVLDQSSVKVRALIDQIQNLTNTSEQKKHDIEELGKSTGRAKKDMQAMLKAFAEVEQTTNEIAGITDVIEDVAASTNLLAMNAAIEAAHAGESGKGFSVVASEIRSLASTTSENANVISSNIKNIIKQIKTSMDLSNKTDAVMEQMTEGVSVAESNFTDIIQTQYGISNSTMQLTNDLESMNQNSVKLKASSIEITAALDSIQQLILSLDDAENSAKSGGPGPSLGLF